MEDLAAVMQRLRELRDSHGLAIGKLMEQHDAGSLFLGRRHRGTARKGRHQFVYRRDLVHDDHLLLPHAPDDAGASKKRFSLFKEHRLRCTYR